MATYVNDLRLKEISTGDESGTWGTSTNTNLELIGEALGYATQQVFGSDADATTTIADGASDPARAMYFKITSAGSLTATRTCTIAPNTVSRVMFIENATTGSQSIAISQGSGASVTILTGKTAVVYLDGAGATAAVVDAMAGVDPGVTDTLTEVLVAGNTSGGTNIELSTTDKVQFRDADIYLNSSVDGQLDIVADTEIQIAATTVDLNGNLDVSGTALVTGVLTTTAATVFNGGFASNADSTLGTDKKVQFRDAAIYINSSVDGQLDIVADTEIQIAATTIDIDGAINASGEIIAASLDISGDIDVDGVTNLDVVDIDGALTGTTATFVGANTLTLRNDTGTDADEPKLTFDNDTFAGANYGNIRTGNGGLQLILESPSTSTFQNRQRILFNSGGSDELSFDLSTDNGSSFTNYFKLDGGNAIFNETGADKDFRIESDTDANALFVEGSSGNVGIGTASPITFGANTHGLTLNGTAAGQHISFQQSGSYKGSLFQSDNSILLGSELGEVKISSATGVVINEAGIDADFRVESNDNANMLFVDGGASRIGIGESAPEYKLDILGASGDQLRLNNGGERFTQMYWQTNGSNKGAIWADDTDSSFAFYAYAGIDADFYSNAQKKLSLRSASVVVNEDSADIDFRVESDGNANMLFVDAGSDTVCIGTSTASGDIANTSPLTAGRFRTLAGVQSAATATATTLVTLPAGFATYIVNAGLSGVNDAGAYGATAIVHTDGSTNSITQLVNPAGMTISMSGMAVQGTQTSGSTLNISFSILRM
jgi:cytoskeletal protein CcmA (bactofilin family)